MRLAGQCRRVRLTSNVRPHRTRSTRRRQFLLQHLMSPYEKATEAFVRGDFVAALQGFERIAHDLPEVWLPVIRCKEALQDEAGAAIANGHLKAAADDGDPAAQFAYHLLTRETNHPSATAVDTEVSREYLRKSSESGFGPAVEQLRADKTSGLY